MATHDLVIRGGNVIDGIPVEQLITQHCQDTAAAVGLADSGQLMPGLGDEIYQNGVAAGALPWRLLRHAG